MLVFADKSSHSAELYNYFTVMVTDVFKALPGSIHANTTLRDLAVNMTLTIWVNRTCPSGSFGTACPLRSSRSLVALMERRVCAGSIGTEALIMASQDTRYPTFRFLVLLSGLTTIVRPQEHGDVCQFLHGRCKYNVEPPEHVRAEVDQESGLDGVKF
jgi:hypothetical protein